MKRTLRIERRDELRRWLADKPPEWSQVIAFRSALRVFPLVVRVLSVSDDVVSLERKQGFILQSWRSMFIASVVRRFPTEEMKQAANAAATAAVAAARAAFVTDDANRATAFAAANAASVFATNPASAFAANAIAAAATDDDAAVTVWEAVDADCRALAGADDPNAAPGELAATNLWHAADDDWPEWFNYAYLDLRNSRIGSTSSWQIIAKWFRVAALGTRVVDNNFFIGDCDKTVALQPDVFWQVTDDRSADRIMDEIAEIAGWKAPESEAEPDYDHARFMIIRVATDDLWQKGNHTTFGRLRYLEHTSDELKAEFGSLSGNAIAKLLNMPVLFAYERGAEGRARLGRLRALSCDERLIDITYEFDSYVPPIAFDRIAQIGRSLGIKSGAEYTRQHWSIKEGDLYAILADAGIISVANDDVADAEEIVEVPPQEPAPIETAITDKRVVRVHTDRTPGKPDIEAIHSILIADAASLAARLDRQAPDAALSLSAICQELGVDTGEMRIYGVGYWAGVLNQISARIDEAVLEDAAGRFAGFLTNLNLFLRHSADWNTYIRTAQNAELADVADSEAEARIPEIIQALAENDDIIAEEVSGPLAALNKALLNAPMYNPETAYGFYRSLANVLQATTELALTDGVQALKAFARDVRTDVRKKAVSLTAGALLTTCGIGLLFLANALPSMFGFLQPILRILGIV